MTRKFLISGKVQGVGFRWFVSRLAHDLAIDGYARNLPDGRVEVFATGSADALEQLRAALERGPTGARVAKLEEVATAEQDRGSARKGFVVL